MPADLVSQRKQVVGIKITRDGAKGTTGFCTDDIRNLMKLIEMVDASVLFMDHKGRAKTADRVSNTRSLLKMDWKSRVDQRTEPWGKPSENRERTHMSFYIAAD